jgi:hypothetical protein
LILLLGWLVVLRLQIVQLSSAVQPLFEHIDTNLFAHFVPLNPGWLLDTGSVPLGVIPIKPFFYQPCDNVYADGDRSPLVAKSQFSRLRIRRPSSSNVSSGADDDEEGEEKKAKTMIVMKGCHLLSKAKNKLLNVSRGPQWPAMSCELIYLCWCCR